MISTPTHTQAPTPNLPPYASEIPATLLQLPDLPITQTNNEPGQADGPESPAVPPDTSDLPQAVPVNPMPPVAPPPTYPINIAPTGTTRTGRQVRTPSRFGYAAYLAKTALSGIADLHPLACLQMISGDINQPEGYPDAMPLDVALAQPDRDNLSGQWRRSSNNTPSSSIGVSSTGHKCHETPSPYLWYGHSAASVTQRALS